MRGGTLSRNLKEILLKIHPKELGMPLIYRTLTLNFLSLDETLSRVWYYNLFGGTSYHAHCYASACEQI